MSTHNPSDKEIFALSLRLSRVMKEALDEYGNMNRLLSAIDEANKIAGTKSRIGRQCLSNLIFTPSEVSLNIEQLVALHIFLRPRGEGLDQYPLLERSRILDWLARSNSLAYLLPSKPSPHARYISHWDFNATVELQGDLSAMGARFQFGCETFLVPHRTHQDVVQIQKLDNYIEGERTSLISIGSPLATPASERILAKMLGVEPFGKPSPGRRLPFYFVWSPHCTTTLKSSFALDPADVPDVSLRTEIESGQATALQIGNDFLRVPVGPKSYKLYGMIAAQRRFNGHVWIVLAGLSGPATFAAAQLVKEIPSALPALPGRNSSVLLAVVETDVVHTGSPEIGGDRIVEGRRVLGTPQIWAAQA